LVSLPQDADPNATTTRNTNDAVRRLNRLMIAPRPHETDS
jgi:hypothetical protein